MEKLKTLEANRKTSRKPYRTPHILLPVFLPLKNIWNASSIKMPESPSAGAMERRRKQNILPYNLVCCISPAEAERAKSYDNWIKELRYLLSIKQYADKDVKVPWNFLTCSMFWSSFKLGQEHDSCWGMVKEAIKSNNILPAPSPFLTMKTSVKTVLFREGPSFCSPLPLRH